MSEQIFNTGNKAVAALGEYTPTKKLPLGYYVEDGLRKYRYAYVRRCRCPGVLLRLQTRPSMQQVASGCFLSITSGYGHAVGDTVIKLRGATFLTAAHLSGAARFEDGFLFITSSSIGTGHCYRVRNYEYGKSNAVSKLFLKDPLRKALSTTGTQGWLGVNPYYGVLSSTTNTGAYYASSVGINMGVTLASTTTSGYGFIQTLGPGMGYAKVAASGVLLGGTAVGQLSTAFSFSTMWLDKDTTHITPQAQAISNVTVANNYMSVDWKVENKPFGFVRAV